MQTNSLTLKVKLRKYAGMLLTPALLLASGLFAQQADRPADYIENAFPLRKGYYRIYEIRRKGVKVGTLDVRVTSERRQKISRYQNIDFYRMQYKDSYLGRTYRRMLARTPDVFVQNPRDGRYYPFLKADLKVGWRMHGMLVVDVSRKPIKGQMRWAATLKHLKEDREEVYMESIGLYYMRNGDMSYHLIDLPW